MITMVTAARIWNAYREIDHSKKRLEEMKTAREQRGDPTLTLGDVLSESIISAYIEIKYGELVKANEMARTELDSAG